MATSEKEGAWVDVGATVAFEVLEGEKVTPSSVGVTITDPAAPVVEYKMSVTSIVTDLPAVLGPREMSRALPEEAFAVTVIPVVTRLSLLHSTTPRKFDVATVSANACRCHDPALPSVILIGAADWFEPVLAMDGRDPVVTMLPGGGEDVAAPASPGPATALSAAVTVIKAKTITMAPNARRLSCIPFNGPPLVSRRAA